jgi:ATP-binding cassette subfamily F protein uup
LFDEISFGIEEGDKIGIIGKNGIGKTTLLNIIGGKDTQDEGSIVFNSKIRFEYLEQNPLLDKDEIIMNEVMNAKPEVIKLLEEYRLLCQEHHSETDQSFKQKLQDITNKLDSLEGWQLETEAKKILTKLGITQFYDNIRYLSGGMRKRVALARALLSNPNLLLLDEPTNHLDADSVQWLQDRLQSTSCSIMFVTHDRYFLDAIATRIIELDQQKIFSYPGSYEDYLERRHLFLASQSSTLEHTLSRLKSELAWLQKGSKARRRKQKSRIDWVEIMKNEIKPYEEKKIKIEVGKSFIGSRIIEAHNISKSLGGKLLFNDFTYIAKPGDRIGIIGPNGSGKSTLLNVLAGLMKPDAGVYKAGLTANIGYFTQESINLNDSNSLITTLREEAEYIDVGVGRDRYLTVKDLLNKFQFPPNRHNNLVGTLSGGEKRRLALLKVLMKNPNVLLLDEPTNDFDIPTLTALEEYLDNFYGVLLIVSHDRAFLDRTVHFIQAFDGKGGIKEYPGNYSIYLEKIEIERNNQSSEESRTKTLWKLNDTPAQLKKLSFKDQREVESIEKELSELEESAGKLRSDLSSGKLEYQDLETSSNQLVETEKRIESLTERWFFLNEKLS